MRLYIRLKTARCACGQPPGVKISPETGLPMDADLGAELSNNNSVWDGNIIRLSGARGEYVSFQLVAEQAGGTPVSGVKITPGGLRSAADALIPADSFELFRNWYARDGAGRWQPAYLAPLGDGGSFDIPDPSRKLPAQRNQSISFELFIPCNARAGAYDGLVDIESRGGPRASVPIHLEVFDFAISNRLSFWPELNAYEIPPNALDYCRLAHRFRCVLNCWKWEPQVSGTGRDVRVQWNEYDRTAGQLLSGAAFAKGHRAGIPTECMYLPFEDKWPSNLTPRNYRYPGHWPGKGEDVSSIVQHYLTAPYIGDALTPEYIDAFQSVQRQFIEHFAANGWNKTQMQCFFGGKNTHRIDYGSNLWWTTDEPAHWDDWLALQYFDRLWSRGRGARTWASGSPERTSPDRNGWGESLDNATQTAYFMPALSVPLRIAGAVAPSPLKCRLGSTTYGGCNADTDSNLGSIRWCPTPG